VKNFYFLFIIKIITIQSSACLRKSDKHLFKVNLSPGDHFNYEIHVNQNIKIMEIDLKQHVTFYQSLYINDLMGDSAYSSESIINRVKIRQEIPGYDTIKFIKIDSKNVDTTQENAYGLLTHILKPILFKKFKLYFNKCGNVFGSGFDDFTKILFKGKKDGHESQIFKNFNFEQFIINLPQKPISVGENYTTENIRGNSDFTVFKIKQSYLLQNVTDSTVTLVYNGIISDDSENPEFFFPIQGEQKGICILDRKTLLVKDNQFIQNLTIDMSVLGFSSIVNSRSISRVKMI